jgi:hypothetical protein
MLVDLFFSLPDLRIYAVGFSLLSFVAEFSTISVSGFFVLLKIKNITSPIVKYTRNSPKASAAKYEKDLPVMFNLVSGGTVAVIIMNEISI